VNGLVVAARYLTIVPLPGRFHHHGGAAVGAAAPWFPIVGLVLGLVLVGVDRVTGLLFPALLASLLTVTVWKLFTGGLHLDGLADCLDGLVGRDADHRLAIMRDSRIGAFAAIGLVLFLMIEIVALAELPEAARWRALLAAPVVARAVPVLLARVFPSARGEGQGAAFVAGVPRWAWVPALVLAGAAPGAVLGASGLVAAGAGIGVAVGLARFVSGRVGGMTGDVFGATVECAELAFLLSVSAWAHARL
jgi:adenosylcobinamide-GDP ribazoletransferase